MSIGQIGGAVKLYFEHTEIPDDTRKSLSLELERAGFHACEIHAAFDALEVAFRQSILPLQEFLQWVGSLRAFSLPRNSTRPKRRTCRRMQRRWHSGER